MTNEDKIKSAFKKSRHSKTKVKPFRVKITRIECYPKFDGLGISWQKLKSAIKETEEENYDENLVIESVKVEKL